MFIAGTSYLASQVCAVRDVKASVVHGYDTITLTTTARQSQVELAGYLSRYYYL